MSHKYYIVVDVGMVFPAEGCASFEAASDKADENFPNNYCWIYTKKSLLQLQESIEKTLEAEEITEEQAK